MQNRKAAASLITLVILDENDSNRRGKNRDEEKTVSGLNEGTKKELLLTYFKNYGLKTQLDSKK